MARLSSAGIAAGAEVQPCELTFLRWVCSESDVPERAEPGRYTKNRMQKLSIIHLYSSWLLVSSCSLTYLICHMWTRKDQRQ